MLVLSRKAGQKIYIGSDITISVIEISGKFVRVGIEAPDAVLILRSEVKEQIEMENRMAASRAKHLDGLKKISPLSSLLSLKIPGKDRPDAEE